MRRAAMIEDRRKSLARAIIASSLGSLGSRTQLLLLLRRPATRRERDEQAPERCLVSARSAANGSAPNRRRERARVWTSSRHAARPWGGDVAAPCAIHRAAFVGHAVQAIDRRDAPAIPDRRPGGPNEPAQQHSRPRSSTTTCAKWLSFRRRARRGAQRQRREAGRRISGFAAEAVLRAEDRPLRRVPTKYPRFAEGLSRAAKHVAGPAAQ